MNYDLSLKLTLSFRKYIKLQKFILLFQLKYKIYQLILPHLHREAKKYYFNKTNYSMEAQTQ